MPGKKAAQYTQDEAQAAVFMADAAQKISAEAYKSVDAGYQATQSRSSVALGKKDMAMLNTDSTKRRFRRTKEVADSMVVDAQGDLTEAQSRETNVSNEYDEEHGNFVTLDKAVSYGREYKNAVDEHTRLAKQARDEGKYAEAVKHGRAAVNAAYRQVNDPEWSNLEYPNKQQHVGVLQESKTAFRSLGKAQTTNGQEMGVELKPGHTMSNGEDEGGMMMAGSRRTGGRGGRRSASPPTKVNITMG